MSHYADATLGSSIKPRWRKITSSQKVSRIGSSSCRCATTSVVVEKAMKKAAKAIPQVLPNVPESFSEDIGRSPDLDQKKMACYAHPQTRRIVEQDR